PPTISSFSPVSGPVGTAVSINGTNFDSSSIVRFNGVSATRTVVSPTQITCTVPGGATSGNISVQETAGTATSSQSFTVTAGGTNVGFAIAANSVDYNANGSAVHGTDPGDRRNAGNSADIMGGRGGGGFQLSGFAGTGGAGSSLLNGQPGTSSAAGAG